jgi:hypothetical protein
MRNTEQASKRYTIPHGPGSRDSQLTYLLNTLIYAVSCDCHFLGLADPMYPINSLSLSHGIPVWLHQVHFRRYAEVNTVFMEEKKVSIKRFEESHVGLVVGRRFQGRHSPFPHGANCRQHHHTGVIRVELIHHLTSLL